MKWINFVNDFIDYLKTPDIKVKESLEVLVLLLRNCSDKERLILYEKLKDKFDYKLFRTTQLSIDTSLDKIREMEREFKNAPKLSTKSLRRLREAYESSRTEFFNI